MSPLPRSLKSLRSDLLLISKLSDDEVKSVSEALSSTSHQIERPERLAVMASEKVELDVAEAIVRQLLSMQTAANRIGCPVTELTENKSHQMRQHLEKDELTSVLEGLEILNQLACLPAIANTSRAIELSYDSDNLLQRTRILTDVRPLFSDDAQSIEGAIVAHTLRLRYDSAGVDHELSLALDSSDLHRLIGDCNRALLKESTAQEKLCKPANVPSMIMQED